MANVPTTCDGEAVKFGNTVCGHILGLALILYGVFNTALWFKFTPVYTAAECGDQTAELENFGLGAGGSFHIKLQIHVACWNYNGYAVEIVSAHPGQVYVGKDRNLVSRDLAVGNLTLVKGSSLPAGGKGAVRADMDALLRGEDAKEWIPHFLEDKELPMFLELQFDVLVDVSFTAFKKFGTTAPFKKKCAMYMAGVLVNTANARLGPMICRDHWYELDGQIPHVGEAALGSMSFSAAQMDPDRVEMGERLKNVSCITMAMLAYCGGSLLLWQWWLSVKDRRHYLQMEEHLANSVRVSPTGVVGKTMGFLRRAVPYGQADFGTAKGGQAVSMLQKPAQNGDAQQGSGSCLFQPVLTFLSCGAAGKGRHAAALNSPLSSAPHQMRQVYCTRAESGNLVEAPKAVWPTSPGSAERGSAAVTAGFGFWR